MPKIILPTQQITPQNITSLRYHYQLTVIFCEIIYKTNITKIIATSARTQPISMFEFKNNDFLMIYYSVYLFDCFILWFFCFVSHLYDLLLLLNIWFLRNSTCPTTPINYLSRSKYEIGICCWTEKWTLYYEINCVNSVAVC